MRHFELNVCVCAHVTDSVHVQYKMCSLGSCDAIQFVHCFLYSAVDANPIHQRADSSWLTQPMPSSSLYLALLHPVFLILRGGDHRYVPLPFHSTSLFAHSLALLLISPLSHSIFSPPFPHITLSPLPSSSPSLYVPQNVYLSLSLSKLLSSQAQPGAKAMRQLYWWCSENTLDQESVLGQCVLNWS